MAGNRGVEVEQRAVGVEHAHLDAAHLAGHVLGYSHVHRHRSNPHDQAVARGRGRRRRKSAPTYTALGAKGLLRKYYLNGEAGGGGVYLWDSEAAARAWYTPDWEKRMEAAFGARPTVTYYDNHVVVDNETGKVKIEE
jgi:hypothetical protein